jgi:YD repeat-containing protein
MNKSIKFFMGLWLLCTAVSGSAQTTTPEASVAGVMAFAENPVDLCSGIPDISIPLVSLPTRSKDISMNVSMAYHPKSGGLNPGLGWNVLAGGAITRRVVYFADEAYGAGVYPGDDVYEFNFMGKSGMFSVEKDPTTNLLGVTHISNKGESLKITLGYSTSATTPFYTISSFTVYDVQGYRYEFTSIDTENDKFPTSRGDFNETWHLTGIFDNNNKKVLSFKYDTVTYPFDVYDNLSLVHEHNYYHRTDSITSNGFGKIIFNYSATPQDGYDVSQQLTGLYMQDQFGVVVKKCNISSSQVDIMDPSATTKETYLFDYKDVDTMLPIGTDAYGYPNTQPPCATGVENYVYTDPKMVTRFSLQKMTLPTGGCVIYDFESNTYNNYVFNDDTTMMDMVTGDDQYFTRNYDTSYIPENNIINPFGLYSFTTAATQDYQITLLSTDVPKTVYCQVNGSDYTVTGFNNPDGSPHIFQPTFTFTKPSGATSPLTLTLLPSSNNDNFCLGASLLFDHAGTYHITIGGTGSAPKTGSAKLQVVTRNPNPTRSFYGYGLRLRASAQFTDGSLDKNYFSDEVGYNALGFLPVKERVYNYDFFGQPKVSSGTVSEEPVSNDYQLLIVYRNVTVTDIPSNGKTQNSFTSAVDYTQSATGVLFYDFRSGLTRKADVFDAAGNVVRSEEMLYEFDDGGFAPGGTLLPKSVGWAPVSQKTTKDYLTGSSSPVISTENFYYSGNRKIATHILLNSDGSTRKSTYDYNTSNSPTSQNRSEPSLITSYRITGSATQTLSTSNIAYSNTFTSNVSYLPSTLSSGKGIETATVRQRYNAYDEYGHVKESQQENGMKTAYIYGYNKTLLVAKIDNIAYASIPPTLITNIQTASNTNNNETAILTTLTALRNDAALAGAMVTTYTYIPLIGVSTVTDAKGDVLKYTYDSFGRLVKVTDKQGNILSENAYHLKTQTP